LPIVAVAQLKLFKMAHRLLVEPDSVAGLVEAIARLDEIRHTCRQQAEAEFFKWAIALSSGFRDILRG